MEQRPLDWVQVDEALTGLRELKGVTVTYIKRGEQDEAFAKLVKEKLPMTCERIGDGLEVHCREGEEEASSGP